jgi:hypothetical protein
LEIQTYIQLNLGVNFLKNDKMKLPTFGKNAIQSYIDFETSTNKVRFGFEGVRLFVEVNEVKKYITGIADEILVDTIAESTTGAGITIDGSLIKDGVLSKKTPLITTPVGTVTVTEYGDGVNMTTILTLTEFVIGAIPAAAAALAIGNIVGSLPASPGVHIEDVFAFSLSLKLPGAAVNADLGLGSVIGSGANATLQAVGATSEDRLTGQTVPTAAAGGTVTKALVRAASGGISLNIAANVKNIFLNAAGTWAIVNEGNLTANGTIVIKWTKIA